MAERGEAVDQEVREARTLPYYAGRTMSPALHGGPRAAASRPVTPTSDVGTDQMTYIRDPASCHRGNPAGGEVHGHSQWHGQRRLGLEKGDWWSSSVRTFVVKLSSVNGLTRSASPGAI